MLLNVQNIHAGYGDSKVLQGVSLGVDAGEVVALIGPNGAGKSTVLKSIFGLVHTTQGTIQWKGHDFAHLPTHALLEEGIGFVPQGRLVFSHLTVKENLEMGGYLINHHPTLHENLETVYGLFPILRSRAEQRAGSLSGGEQQMLAIGRSLMMSPQLLLLDEPSLGLSPVMQHHVFTALERLRQGGTSLLIVEQNVRLVLSLASRGYLLANGQVVHAGSAAELGRPEVMAEAYLGAKV